MLNRPDGLLNRRQFELWGAALFLSAFVFYLSTAPHTIFTNDNAEFVTAAATAGIPHPSGYPLFVILTWLFAKLPFGSVAYRLNIFSGLCQALSLVLLYVILQKAFVKIGARIAAAPYFVAVLVLPLAFTQMYWYQAIIAKTYSLNLLLTLGLLLLAVRLLETGKAKWLYLSAFMAGLGAANHQMFLLYLPFLAGILCRRGLWNAKKFLMAGGLFILGLAPYVYIPLRAAAAPLLNSGRVHDWLSFWNFISRAQYGDMGVGADFGEKMKFAAGFMELVMRQFNWAAVLAVVGLIWSFKYARRWFYLLTALLAANFLGIVMLRETAYSYANLEFYATYFLPAYVAVYFFIAVGIVALAELAGKYARALIAAAAIILAALYLEMNAAINFDRHFVFIDELAGLTLISLPRNSVYIMSIGNTSSDTTAFSAIYERAVNNLRPDVAVVAMPDVFPQVDEAAALAAFAQNDVFNRRRALYDYAKRTYPGRPIFATFPFVEYDEQLRQCAAARSNGFAYGAYATAASGYRLFGPSLRDRTILNQDIFGQQYLADYYYKRAAAELYEPDKKIAPKDVENAIAADPQPGSLQFVDYQRLRTMAGK